MNKSHPFSIYLLSEGFDPSNALEDNHPLKLTSASNLPETSSYILDDEAQEPWWKDYFGIDYSIVWQTKEAFLPALLLQLAQISF